MKKKKTQVYVVAVLLILACMLTATTYIAVRFFVGNIHLFTAFMVIVPTIGIAIAAFLIGFLIKWNWKRGVGIALVLTLISFGTGELVTHVMGDEIDSITENGITGISEDEELKQEIYDELDKKAYEYMLEQGLISEGEEIRSEGNFMEEENDNEIVGSELYVGIQKSDVTTELMGSVVDFLAAFGMTFVGDKVKRVKEKGKGKRK